MAAKFDVEWDPKHCPSCRHIYRAMFAANLILHSRKSDLSGKSLLSIFSERKPFPVYSVDEWWSDSWDGMTYGQPVDLSRPFFPQFENLFVKVPKMATLNENSENCDYSCNTGNTKNAYYCLRAYRSEDMYYSESVTGYNHDLIDCLRCQKSSECWECVQCVDCHYGVFLHRCFGTRDSAFCIDCRGCDNCLFCSNLRNTSYHVDNRPVSKEEFTKIKATVLDGRQSTLLQNLERMNNVHKRTIWPNVLQVNCEDCRGDQLLNCKACVECYDCCNCFQNRQCWDLSPSKECVSWMEVTRGGIGELVFNSGSIGGGNYFIRMCAKCRLSSNLTYCIDCYSCKDCFGCTGLRNKQFCILNTQYTKEEYEKTVRDVITHMKKTAEWGQFFPVDCSPFAFNESSAMTYLTLSKEEVLSRGWRWEDQPELSQDGEEHRSTLPDSIDEVTDDITTKILFCEQTGRKFKIIPQELHYYRLFHCPLPRHHPDVRMRRRRDMLNPYRLWKRKCAKCAANIETSFAPDRPEIVYCERCYLETVY